MFLDKREIPLSKDLKEFISEFNITESYNEHSDKTTHFLVEKVNELLDIILTISNDELQIKAILLASNPQMNLIKAMMKNGIIYSKVTQLINTHLELPNFIIARICSLFTGILRSFPENSQEIAPYLLNFLPYTDNHVVLSLYEIVFDKGNLNKPIISMIQSLDAPSLLFGTIESRKNDFPLTCAILKIAILFCNDPQLLVKFKTEYNIRKVLIFLQSTSSDVLYQAYLLCSTLLDAQTKVFLMPALKTAISSFKDIFPHLNEYRVAMMNFITEMQTFGISFYQVNENQFFEVILRLFAQFPNNTPMMLAVAHYIEECLKDKKLFASVMSNIIQAVIDFASYEEHNALHIICMLLLQNIKKLYGNTKEFKELANLTMNAYFLQKVHPQYMSLLKKPYGGKIEKKIINVFLEDPALY